MACCYQVTDKNGHTRLLMARTPVLKLKGKKIKKEIKK